MGTFVYIYRDSSLKIQMEYRAFEERAGNGIKRVKEERGWELKVVESTGERKKKKTEQ